MITCLAGGVGAARFLSGLVQVVPPEEITAVVNTGDDIVLHGLHISPDLDTVTYTLAGAINPETGWGLAGETWSAMQSLDRYGGQSWFRLGDRDLATHMYRTQRLAEGAPLHEVTAEITKSWGLDLRVIPMSNDRVETRITLKAGTEIGFQQWFVGQQHATAVSSISFEGAVDSTPAPGVLEAIESADVTVICPSNPIVSIGPLLEVPGVADALIARRDSCVAISPIIAGRALKGPADSLMSDLGHEPSVMGVARLYAKFASVLVVDEADASRAAVVEAEGIRCVVAPTIMSSPAAAADLARATIDAVR
ncbi:MAG TPA: 2-phospho-L-lactate transferase [Acidimicrobiales bacterium]|nr:2-phospho-L-lactate transferase [Acidimicrobiales bacterium]